MAGSRRPRAVVASGEVRLVRQDGRFLLVQGDTVIDVTRVMVAQNYPAGRVTLALRVSPGERLALAEPEPDSAEAVLAAV